MLRNESKYRLYRRGASNRCFSCTVKLVPTQLELRETMDTSRETEVTRHLAIKNSSNGSALVNAPDPVERGETLVGDWALENVRGDNFRCACGQTAPLDSAETPSAALSNYWPTQTDFR